MRFLIVGMLLMATPVFAQVTPENAASYARQFTVLKRELDSNNEMLRGVCQNMQPPQVSYCYVLSGRLNDYSSRAGVLSRFLMATALVAPQHRVRYLAEYVAEYAEEQKPLFEGAVEHTNRFLGSIQNARVQQIGRNLIALAQDGRRLMREASLLP